MFGWLTGKNDNQKNGKKHKQPHLPSAPSKPALPDPIQQQQLKYSYEEAQKLQIERAHQQKVTQMRKQTIYKDAIWSAVIVDLDNLNNFDMDTTDSVNKQNEYLNNIPITTSIIPITNIDIDTKIEEYVNFLTETNEMNDAEEKKEWAEWLEQYNKRQELKQNIKETVHKTAEFSKYAWKKSVKFTTTATSALFSATSNALTKIEKYKKEKDLKKLEGQSDEKEDDRNDEQIEGQSDKNKKKNDSNSLWGYLDINKYKKKTNTNAYDDKSDTHTSTFNPYES